MSGILHRHADGPRKPLDSHNCECRLEHLTGQLDLDLDLEDEDEEWWTSNGLTFNFSDVLYSIAATGKRLESLSAYLWAHNILSWRLQGIELAAMPPIARLRSGLLTAFGGFRTLHLSVSCRLNEEIDAIPLHLKHRYLDSPQDWLAEFVALMPALQDLRLWLDGLNVPEDSENVDGPHSSHQDNPPAVSAANYSVLQKFFNTRLPNLKRFELNNTMMPSLGFVNWLQNSGSNIEHLSFRRVGLETRLRRRLGRSYLTL